VFDRLLAYHNGRSERRNEPIRIRVQRGKMRESQVKCDFRLILIGKKKHSVFVFLFVFGYSRSTFSTGGSTNESPIPSY